jgi:hypothetical protein
MERTFPARVFISYSHLDGTATAEQLRKELESSGLSVWLDSKRLTAGATWSTEIEQAVDGCDALVALISRGSHASDICRGEHLRALRAGKRVIPVLLSPCADRPIYLEASQYILCDSPTVLHGVRDQLLAALAERKLTVLPKQFRETYVTAPRLQPGLVARLTDLTTLKQSVLKDDAHDTIAVVAAVGMGGTGKTTLAQVLSHEPAVQDAFPHGVIWVSLGDEVKDFVPKLREVGRALGDAPEHYDTVEGATNRLRTVLRRKAALIVLDDVWRLSQVEPFLAEAPASRLLMTTRRQDLPVSLQATVVPIGVLSTEQSLEILANWTGLSVKQIPPEAAAIVRETGRLPLALSMVGALVRRGLARERTDAWSTVLSRLTTAQLDRIRFPLENYPYPELQRAIQISVDSLDSLSQSRYLMMSVFPEDVGIPEQTLATYWRVGEDAAAETVDNWLDASLAQRNRGRVVLHDLQLDFVRNVCNSQPQRLHREILDAYALRNGSKWHEGPDDGYYFQHLAWHIAAAKDWTLLAALLLDQQFVRARLDASSYVELKQDFNWIGECKAALSRTEDRERLISLKAAVDKLSSFIARRQLNSIVEEWLARAQSDCLVITGAPGTGKTKLMEDIWARHFQDAILVTLSIARRSPDFEMDIAAAIFAGLGTGDLTTLALRSPFELWSKIFETVRGARRKLLLLLDGVDEVDIQGLPKLRRLSDALKVLASFDIRVVASARPGPELEALTSCMRSIERVSVDLMTSEESQRFFRHQVGSIWDQLPQSTRDRLLEVSEGSPVLMSILGDRIRVGKLTAATLNGRGFTALTGSLGEYIDARLRTLLSALPERLAQCLVARIAQHGQVAWSELQLLSRAPDSMVQVIEESGLFRMDHETDTIYAIHESVRVRVQAIYSQGNGLGG